MIDQVIVYTRAEDGGVSVVHSAYRGRLATMWIYPGKGGGLVYFDSPLVGLEPLAMPGDPVPPAKWVSDVDYEIAIAAGAFESDDAFLARLMRDAVPSDATDVTLTSRAKIPASRVDRVKWRLDEMGVVAVDAGATLVDSPALPG